MHKSIISFTCALTLAALAASPSIAAEPAKAPTSVDSCMLLLVMSGNKIGAAKLQGKALADVKSKGQLISPLKRLRPEFTSRSCDGI